jgi:hypothetical protein
LAVVAGVAAGASFFLLNKKSPVREQVTIEAGTEVSLKAFLEEPDTAAEFLTDISLIDTAMLGEYPVNIRVGKKEYASVLTVADTIAPTAEAVPVTIFSGDALEAGDCVDGRGDGSGRGPYR